MSQETESGAEYDKEIFGRLGIMTIVWVVLLVAAGVALLQFGGALEQLVV
jgi:hypothetical protein